MSQRPVRSDGVDFLVVGSPRSGTTLVQRLAAELAGVGLPPETHFFDLFVPAALDRGPPPWTAERLAAEIRCWHAMEQVRDLPLDVEALVADMDGRCESFTALFTAIVHRLVGPAQVVGEKTPEHLLWWEPLAAAMPKLRFVLVVRDPVDVVASTLGAPWAASAVGAEWTWDRYLALAQRWRSEQDESLRLLARLPRRVLLLRYEDVVGSPDAARDRLGEFLGAPRRTEASAAGTAAIQPWETWKQRATGPITTDRVGSGRRQLGARRAAAVAMLCRGPGARLGYAMRAGDRLIGSVAVATMPPSSVRRLRGLRRGLDKAARSRRQVQLASGAAPGSALAD